MDIADWLRGLGLEKYAPAFDENAINWDVLSELTTDDLKEISVAAVGDSCEWRDVVDRGITNTTGGTRRSGRRCR